MKYIVYLVALLCLISPVSAATIYGNIYDISLNKMENVIVEINTQPKQQYISKNGTYAFNVPSGEYTIKANHYINKILESTASENITVKNEGIFVLDLILFPVIDSELIEEGPIDIEEDYLKEKLSYWWYVAIAVIAVVLVTLPSYLAKKRAIEEDKKDAQKGEAKKETRKEEKEQKEEPEKTKKEEDYYDKVLSIIKESKRITQKEIRKQIPLSEAKISLIITELESKGIVKKIKKGRGNVIILEKE